MGRGHALRWGVATAATATGTAATTAAALAAAAAAASFCLLCAAARVRPQRRLLCTTTCNAIITNRLSLPRRATHDTTHDTTRHQQDVNSQLFRTFLAATGGSQHMQGMSKRDSKKGPNDKQLNPPKPLTE